MKKLLLLVILTLAAYMSQAQMSLLVTGQVTSSSGFSIAGLPVEIGYDSLPGGIFIPPVITHTNNQGFFSDTLASFPGAFVKVTIHDCNGGLLVQHQPIAPGIPVVNFQFNNYCAAQHFQCLATFSSYANPSNPLQFGFNLLQGAVPSTTLLIWSFGDGNSFSANGNPNATHTYANPGVYTVSVLMVDSSRNCSTIYTDSVFASQPVNLNCQANFHVFPLPSPISPLGIYRFNMIVTGSPTARVLLDFGDSTFFSGPINALPTIDHQYLNPGVYHACITVTDTANNCTSNYCHPVAVHPVSPGICHADFQFQYTAGAAPNSVQFHNLSTNSSGHPAHYVWQFGDGSSSNQMSPSHIYTTNGTFAVTLTIIDSLGMCSDTFVDSVYIGPTNQNCQVSYTFSSSPSFGGSIVSFVHATNAQGPLMYAWDFGNGQIVNQDNPVTYLIPGSYRVCLTITSISTGCVATFCDSVFVSNTVINFCNPHFIKTTPSGNAPVTVNFVNTSTGGGGATHYYWNFGDGSTSTFFQGAHTYTANGTYVVTLLMFDSLSHCQNAFYDTVVIGTTPQNCQSFFSMTTNPANPLNISFVNQSTFNSSQNVTYRWSFGDGSPMVTFANPIHNYTAPGTYNVCLTITGPNCSDTYCTTITVGQNQNTFNLNGMISGPTAGIGNNINVYLFEVQSNGSWMPVDTTMAIDTAGFFIYNFSGLASSSYAVLAELTPTSPQGQLFFPTYVGNTVSWNSAILIYLNGATASLPWNINMINFLILPAGGGGTINGNVLRGNLRVASGNMPNVTVQLLDASLSPIRTSRTDAQGQFNFLDLPMGAYFVHIDWPGRPCTPIPVNLMAGQSAANGVNFTMNRGNILTSIQEQFSGNVDKIYPNPVRDQLFAEVNLTADGAYQLEVYSLSGQRVRLETRNLLRGNQRLEIQTQELPSGLYLMRLTDPQGAATQWKVSKQ